MQPGKYGYRSGGIMIKPVDENDIWNCKWDIILEDVEYSKIGWVSLEGEKSRGSVPISIEIDPLYRKRGYGTSVLKMMREWVFLHRDIFEIRAEASNENTDYIHALERAGFVYREGLSVNKGDIEYYTITRQKVSWMGIYIVIGIIAGTILGIVLGNMWIGLAIAVIVGLALGAYMDYTERSWREKITGSKK